jgi:hypothetical protein
VREELRHAHAVGVERLGGIDVADLANRRASDLLVVDARTRRDLPCQDDIAGLAEHLAGDARGRVLLEVRVEHAVGDEVTHLVGVTLGDGLRGEDVQCAAGSGARPCRDCHGRVLPV